MKLAAVTACGNFRQFGEPRGERLARLQESAQGSPPCRARHRVVDQIERGRHQFAVRVFQVQRVEIEADARQQREADHREQAGGGEHPGAALEQQTVEQRGTAKPDRLGLAARPQHHEQRRQQREIQRRSR